MKVLLHENLVWSPTTPTSQRLGEKLARGKQRKGIFLSALGEKNLQMLSASVTKVSFETLPLTLKMSVDLVRFPNL